MSQTNFRVWVVVVVTGSCGHVISVLAFCSDDQSSNPTEVHNFCVKMMPKRTNINEKRPVLTHF